MTPSQSGTPLRYGVADWALNSLPPLGIPTVSINQSNIRDTSATRRHARCLDPRAMPQLSPEHEVQTFRSQFACLPQLFSQLSAINRAHPNLPNTLEHWQTQDLIGKLGTNHSTCSCQYACANPTQRTRGSGPAPSLTIFKCHLNDRKQSPLHKLRSIWVWA